MNSHQAKQIDFPDLLSRLGHEPVKVRNGGRELWYLSPFREEHEPSFHTSFLGGKWIWNDFGDSGGNIIDFVMRHEGISFKEALAFLRNIYQKHVPLESRKRQSSSPKPSSTIPFQQQSKQSASVSEDERELEFLEANEIKHPTIISYLENVRKIPISLARMYLKEVKYRHKSRDKIFFAFGMENESGGYEIRSASDQYKFKSALIKRDITVVKGRGAESNSVSVFEGMTDFLSFLVLEDRDRLEGDAIVMHSVSSFDRTVEYIKRQEYRQIFTFLDNDKVGSKYGVQIGKVFPLKSINRNIYFKPFKDINEFLVKDFIRNMD